MSSRTVILLAVAALIAYGAASPLPAAEAGLGWSQAKAFDYLEARQQQWANWKPAQKFGGACISCHTGLSYMLARRVMGEKQAPPAVAALVEGVKARVLSDPPKTMLSDPGAEVILSLLTLSLQRRSSEDAMSDADRVELKRLWEAQVKEGEDKGAWSWFMNDLHPVESEHSVFFGAVLAERALAGYPADAATADRAALLQEYLKRDAPKQPLHNRLGWIAFSGEAKKDKHAKAAVLRDLWAAQSNDGGWTAAALGPWSAREGAPRDAGSNAYATAWAAFTARESGVACSDAKLRRAMDWLRRRQDAGTGAWPAVSMNKVFAEGSMQSKFMTDAATGYAAAALVGCNDGE